MRRLALAAALGCVNVVKTPAFVAEHLDLVEHAISIP